MHYPGGKNAGGAYQRIINQIPPHQLYIEAFAGSAAVLRHKRPARLSIALDLDAAALDALREVVPPRTELLNIDAIDYLSGPSADGWGQETFVYCDPPYLPGTRVKKRIYAHELTEADHRRLLDVLCGLACPVMLSGYWSDLYAERLAGWRTDRFDLMTRGGTMGQECLWMNYPPPLALHDYRYLGNGYREREKFRRRRRRWAARLARLDPLERRALLAAMQETESE